MGKIVVGKKVLMELAGIRDKLESFFVGYINRRCVITTFPLVPDVNRPMLLEHLYKGNSLTVRYIHSGTVMGFTSEIQHVAFTPYSLLFLKYPGQIESMNLRKDDRVDCLFPATVVLKSVSIPGALSDISRSGCNIALPVTEDHTFSAEIGSQVDLHCPLLFASDQAKISCTVKQLNKNTLKIALGLMFSHVPNDLLTLINAYIEQTRMFMDVD